MPPDPQCESTLDFRSDDPFEGVAFRCILGAGHVPEGMHFAAGEVRGYKYSEEPVNEKTYQYTMTWREKG